MKIDKEISLTVAFKGEEVKNLLEILKTAILFHRPKSNFYNIIEGYINDVEKELNK